jgi:hypothetical protein
MEIRRILLNHAAFALAPWNTKRLNDHWPFWIRKALCSDMLDAVAPVCSKEVKPQTVIFLIDCREKDSAESRPLCGIEEAFENRILHSPAKPLADLGNLSESSSTVLILRDVIAHQYHHCYFQINAG